MNNPSNDIWGGWKMQNMDDRHYYQLSTWSTERKPGILARVWQALSREWADLVCRVEELARVPESTMNEECGCAEA